MESRFQDFVERNSWLSLSIPREIGMIGYARFKNDVEGFDSAINDFLGEEKGSLVGVGYPLNDWESKFEAESLAERFSDFVPLHELHHKYWNLDRHPFSWVTAVNWNLGWNKLMDIAHRSQKIVLMCSEINHERCHRSVIAGQLANRINVSKIWDLNTGKIHA